MRPARPTGARRGGGRSPRASFNFVGRPIKISAVVLLDRGSPEPLDDAPTLPQFPFFAQALLQAVGKGGEVGPVVVRVDVGAAHHAPSSGSRPAPRRTERAAMTARSN